MAKLPKYTEPLPLCEGPKLHPFPKPKAAVTFKRLLSDIEAEGHAQVFEATIGSATYAIKIFKYYDFGEARDGLVGEKEESISDDLLQAHMDPFYNECRAYGRLEEANLNGKVAVRCHGYMTFPTEDEEELARRFNVRDWNRPSDEYDKIVSQRQPLRATIKVLVRKDIPMTGKVAAKILRDMKRMRKCGVYVGEVYPRNYMAGLLIDLSVAKTEPYYLFNLRPGFQTELIKMGDLYAWEDMRTEYELDTTIRAVRDEEYCGHLRPPRNVGKRNGAQVMDIKLVFVMYSTLYTALETIYAILKPFRSLVDMCAIFPAMRAAAKREMFSIPLAWADSARRMASLHRRSGCGKGNRGKVLGGKNLL